MEIPSDGLSSPASSCSSDAEEELFKRNLYRMESGLPSLNQLGEGGYSLADFDPGSPKEIDCKCRGGKMIRRRSNAERSRGKMYYTCPKTKKTEIKGKWDWGCGKFLWDDKLTRSCFDVASSSGSTPPQISHGSSIPTSTAEKRIKALSEALEISQNGNRALVDIVRDLANLPLDN